MLVYQRVIQVDWFQAFLLHMSNSQGYALSISTMTFRLVASMQYDSARLACPMLPSGRTCT